MKVSTLNGKRLLVVTNEPILGDAIHYNYLPVCKGIFKRLGWFLIEKYKNFTRIMGIDFYLEVRKVRPTDYELS